jgi:hypothetical protein
MIYVGIDGGLKGAVVAIDSEGKLIYKMIMPVLKSSSSRTEYDIPVICNIFKNFIVEYGLDNIVVGLERAQITYLSGKNSCFGMGYYYGMLQGILTALGISYQVFRAVDWQKEILKGIAGDDPKQKSIIWCKRKYPNESFKATERCTKDHDGTTDALCIATYLKVKSNGKKESC